MIACALYSYWSVFFIGTVVAVVSWVAGWISRVQVAESVARPTSEHGTYAEAVAALAGPWGRLYALPDDSLGTYQAQAIELCAELSLEELAEMIPELVALLDAARAERVRRAPTVWS